MFDVNFKSYFDVVFEVEKAPEVDCYLLTGISHQKSVWELVDIH